ncbi:hypothetical protein BS78_05G204700 [Paspalum vaginatum]|nr:hypothetical protein BS78_05G204700 [Paspalum vaginatum]
MEAAAISALLPKLATLLTDEYKLQSGAKDDVKYIEKELSSMQAALEAVSRSRVPPAAAGHLNPNDGQLRIWARRLRELAYDAEDTVDSYLVRVSSTRQVAGLSPAARRYKARRRVAVEIERIKMEVKEASDRLKRFSIPEAAPRSPPPADDPRLPLLYKNQTRLVGMGRSTEELIRLLLPPSPHGDGDTRLKVVAVVGAGGIGKTTLAREVYDKLREKFDCGAFVPVSQRPNKKSILGGILRQVSQSSFDNLESWGDYEVIERIRDVLVDKRYFIVIDDIWDESAWEYINCALVQNNRGSKVITTTRKISIAKLCCSPDYDEAIVHELQPLSDVDSQKLFYNRVFGKHSCPSEEFKHRSDQILKRCAGLPLAIVTIASLLANKNTLDEWSYVFNSINDEHTSSGLENMRWILSLSYYDLPPEQKPCMLYLSLFPEDHIIETDDLIWRWIGEGFVHAKRDSRNLYELGEGYFSELVSRSIVQPVHVDTHGKIQSCRVHDIVLEFITSLSLEENFVTINGHRTNTSEPNMVHRRLSYQDSKEEQVISQATNNLSHVRTLSIFCHAADLKLPLSSFQVLRVLDLEDSRGHNIGDISNLFHLRYLRLWGTHCTVEVPKQIGNLQLLQTLDLKRTKTRPLPSTLVQLGQLLRLCVDRQTQLPEGIGSMQSLEELSEVDTGKNPNLMEELGKLSKLRVLAISIDTWDAKHKEALLNCLCNLTELRTLHVFSQDVSLDFMLGSDWTWAPQRLQRFTACVHRHTGDIFRLSPSSIWSESSPFSRLPNWIKLSLPNLSHLAIMVNTLPRKDLRVLGSLPALRSLDLHVVKACAREGMETIGSSSADHAVVAFPCLANFRYASRAVGLVFRRQAMPKLQVLSLSFDVAETKYVYGDFDLGLENLTSLKVVDVGIDCRCATPWEVLDAEAAIKNSVKLNPSHPTLDLRRHFVREMPWNTTIEIPELETIQEELAGLTKIGPWGGSGGTPHDINVAPHRLESVIIRSDRVINSFSFSYYDHDGQMHTAGPWGGCGGSEHEIHFEHPEFLINISGTVGSYDASPNIITCLAFVTNTNRYGPYGVARGHPFDIAIQKNDASIVGFFGHAGWFVHSIGVYVNLREKTDGLVKFAPWGGNGGKPEDMNVAPYRLERITVSSGTIIDSIEFSYTDHNGHCHTIGPWGGYGGNNDPVKLDPSEFLTGVSGSIGPFQKLPKVVTSLTFVTNAHSYGPYGEGRGTPFHFPIQSNGCIVGFFGRYGRYLDAIGVYMKHELKMMRQDEDWALG